MNSKLWIVKILLILAFFGIVAAQCQVPAAPQVVEKEVVKEVVVTATPEAEASAKTQLVYMTHSHDPANRTNAQLIEEFQELNPDVEIVYDNAPHANFEQKILTAYAGGAGPDVFWAGDWMVPQFIENNIIAPVDYTQYGVNSMDEFKELFNPGSLDPFIVDDQVYTGGVSEYNTFSLIYNVDHFEEAGLPLPSEDEPMTWEQFAEYAEQLAQRDDSGNLNRVAFTTPYGVPIWTVLILEPMLHQLGGQLINPETGKPDFTSPEMIKVMQYWQDLRQTQNAIDPALDLDLLTDFSNGNASTIIAGPWALPNIDENNPDLNYAIAPLPVWENGDRVTTLYAWAWFVNPESENQELAWQFVEFLTSKGDLWWDSTGYVQARQGQAANGEDLNDYRLSSEPRLADFLPDYEYGKYEFRSSAYFELSDIWTRAFTRILEGEDVESVLQEAQVAADFATE
jgi:ABC-type glycerol-3-phosphate transport system substrate-binding protein